MEYKAFNYLSPKKMTFISEYNYYADVNEAEEDDGTADEDNSDNNQDIDLDAPELEDNNDFEDIDAEIEGDGNQDTDIENTPSEDNDVPSMEGDDNEVEIDVTDIINKQDEMLNKYNEIIGAINGMKASYGTDLKSIKQDINSLNTKIEGTEGSIKQELRKRVPTPNEKLELRSMSSFPYSTKLSDYWKPADQEDEYEFSIQNNSNNNYLDKAEKENDEYVLKMSDVYDGYNEYDIEKSM